MTWRDTSAAEEAIEQEINWYKEWPSDEDDEAILSVYENCLQLIRECPTQETAQWKFVGDNGYYEPYFLCTNCKYHSKNVDKFCPNCGARME